MAPVDQFIAAIAQQESGGNYNVVNSGSGAIGKYQIMPANVTPWAKQYLGINITPAQFRASPALQDQLGRAVLSDYYNRYGAAGAASAWYSGNPNAYASTSSQKGGPSIKGYVDSVLGKMGNVQVDLTKQSPDSPLYPYPKQQTPNPMESVSGLGLDAATGLDAASGAGLERADGSIPVPSATQAANGAPGSTPKASTTALDYGDGGASGLRAAVLGIGQKYLGVPYVWGGTSDYGLDCSGLVQKVLGQVGIKMPRVSYAQLSMGPRVSLDQAQPGDLIGWGDGHHVAIYIGNGQILEAPRTGLNVRVRSLGDSWDRSQGFYAVSMANYYK